MNKVVLRHAVIGCGGAAHTHAQAIQKVRNVKLVAVASRSSDKAKEFAKQYSIKHYESIDELLESPDIDSVSICTSSGNHAAAAIMAAKNKKHAIIEKPLAVNVAQCRAVIEAFERNSVKGGVISQKRFATDILRAKEILSSGRLGDIIMANLSMKYHRTQEYYDSGGWRGTWEQDGGGALMNQGIHGVDMLLFLMGGVKNTYGYIKALTHKISVEDNAVAVVEFDTGAIGTISASTSMIPAQSRMLEINGTKGSMLIEEDVIKALHIENEESFIGEERQSSKSSTSHIAMAEGHILQLEDFVDSILNDRDPKVTLYDGMHAVELITRVYASSEVNSIYSRHAGGV